MGTLGQNAMESCYSTSPLGDPTISWEKVRMTNIAVDIEFFNGVVSGSVDMFKDLRTDIIITGGGRAIPSYFGQSAPNANLGSVEGKGYEVDLRVNYRLTNGMRLWANTNFTHAVNK